MTANFSLPPFSTRAFECEMELARKPANSLQQHRLLVVWLLVYKVFIAESYLAIIPAIMLPVKITGYTQSHQFQPLKRAIAIH